LFRRAPYCTSSGENAWMWMSGTSVLTAKQMLRAVAERNSHKNSYTEECGSGM
jgi:hypothetical protein